MTAEHRGRHARHRLTGPGLPYATLGHTTPRVSQAKQLLTTDAQWLPDLIDLAVLDRRASSRGRPW